MFKAKDNSCFDWAAKVLIVFLLVGLMLKYLQAVQWQVWPLYKVDWVGAWACGENKQKKRICPQEK